MILILEIENNRKEYQTSNKTSAGISLLVLKFLVLVFCLI